MNVFISGGCKNGKSMFAQRVSKRLAGDGPLYYIATMIPKDDEDRARIARHLRERDGWGFETVECPTNIMAALDGRPNGTFLLDSVTALLLNEMFKVDYNKATDPDCGEEIASSLVEFSKRANNVVFVSDYIYSDSAIYDELTDNYRKALGCCDKALAACCESVVEVCEGNKIYYKGEEWE